MWMSSLKILFSYTNAHNIRDIWSATHACFKTNWNPWENFLFSLLSNRQTIKKVSSQIFRKYLQYMMPLRFLRSRFYEISRMTRPLPLASSHPRIIMISYAWILCYVCSINLKLFLAIQIASIFFIFGSNICPKNHWFTQTYILENSKNNYQSKSTYWHLSTEFRAHKIHRIQGCRSEIP